MSAVARQSAFEQDEAVDWEGIGREIGVAPFESCRDRSAAALVACQRYVRMKGAPLGLEAGPDAGPIDLGGKLGNRLSRFHARPQSAAVAPIEASGARQPNLEGRKPDFQKRIADVVCQRALHLADEAQRQVQIVVADPPELGAVVHRIDEQVADWLGRANCNEKPVHERRDCRSCAEMSHTRRGRLG